MKFTYPVLLSFSFIITTIFGQTIPIDVTSQQKSNPEFMASSAAFMYGMLEGDFNNETGTFDSVYLGNGLVEVVSNLDLTNIRFPGGTLSQFYHFRGANGYGATPEELFCRPNYIPLNDFYTKVSNDYKYPKNMIHYYVELIQALEESQNRTIGTHYVINIMTHFFNGDFFPINPYLDAFILSHGAEITSLLEANPATLTDVQLGQIVGVMTSVMQDPIIQDLIAFLVAQPGFLTRFTENIEAIQFLIDHDIEVKGVELGNECYAFDMLHDDDLSHIPYDCLTPDSVLLEIGSYYLPVKVYMQAMIKYAMVSSMYNTVIKDLWNLETGIVVNAVDFGVNLVEIDSFQLVQYFGEKARFNEIWNQFMGQLTFPDAVIPHIYHQPLPDCNIYGQFSEDTIEIFTTSRLNYYFNVAIPWQFNKIAESTLGKKMWISEWNINGANFIANTFAHASHTYRFLNMMNRLQEEYNIEHINYHLLLAWNFNLFGLLRSGLTPEQTYGITPQAMYHALEFMKPVNHAALPLASSDFALWLGEDFNDDKNLFWGYFDTDSNTYSITFLNQSEEDLTLNLSNIYFEYSLDSVFQDSLIATGYNLNYLDANSIFSSNSGCIDYPEIFDSYDIITENGVSLSLEENSITLPAYSFGLIEIIMTNDIPTFVKNNWSNDIKIYPNPAVNTIHFSLENDKHPSFKVNIWDELGKTFLTENISSNHPSIDVSALANGIYFIQLIDSDGQIFNGQKVIIHHK
jgi:hypothetical protein